MSLIILERDEHTAMLYFNRPSKMNALSFELVQDFHNALEEIAKSPPRLLIISGKGKAFCAGHDLTSTPSDPNSDDAKLLMNMLQNITLLLTEMPSVNIAVVNGHALGAGCEIALTCDLIIASERAIFGFPEVDVGLSITQGISYYLPRFTSLSKAKELLFFSKRFSATKAYDLNVINCVVPHDLLWLQLQEWKESLLNKPHHSLLAAKRLLNNGLNSSLQESLKKEIEVLQTLLINKTTKTNTSLGEW